MISCVPCEYFLWAGDCLNFCILHLGFLIYLLHVPAVLFLLRGMQPLYLVQIITNIYISKQLQSKRKLLLNLNNDTVMYLFSSTT